MGVDAEKKGAASSLVFEVAGAEPDALSSLSFGASSERVSLALAFDELGPRGSREAIGLASLSNELSLIELRRFLHRACYLLRAGGELTFIARDPDEFPDGLWPGEPASFDGRAERYRPLRQYLELLRLFPLSVRTPRSLELPRGGRFLAWRAVRTEDVEVPGSPGEPRERYGRAYRRFDRLEEPEITDDLLYAAARLRPTVGERVLALGVNDGRELEMFAPATRAAVEFWGIDHSNEAIAEARARFPTHAQRFLAADLADLAKLELPRFEVCLLLNVLQCTSVDRDRLLADLKPHLATNARLLASIPNCHFGTGDVLRRPLRRDDPRHDRSLVQKDLRYLARELYRSGFRSVETFGTYDAFLLARR